MSQDETESNIRTIADQRTKHNERVKKASMPLDQRVLELEADLVRVIDSLVDLDYQIKHNERMLKLIIRKLASMADKIV